MQLQRPSCKGTSDKKSLTFEIETTCGQSGQAIHIEIDSELNYSVAEKDAKPLIFVPSVNFRELEDPSIIDAF